MDIASNLTFPEVTATTTKIISDEVAIVLLNIVKSWVNGFISLFGIGTNTINVIVFLKQGWQDTTNISLFALATADLGCLISNFFKSVMFNPILNDADVNFDGRSIVFFLCGMPRYYFTMVASCVTAYITFERCICIALPFKFKSIITPFRSAMTCIGIFLVCIMIYAPIYTTGKIDYAWSPKKNRTLLRMVFNDSQSRVDSIVFGITTVLTVATFLFVVVCTCILVATLWRQRKWREENAGGKTDAGEVAAQKDRKLVKMIIVISCMYIGLFLPGTIRKCAMSIVPGLGKGGVHGNLRHVISSFTDIAEGINSSMNIFVYLHMSTKYRSVFRKTFCCEKYDVK